MGLADLHMHTSVSDGMASPKETLDYIAKHRNHLDVIAITDHDRLDGALWAYEHQHHYPFEVVVGMEVSSAEGDVLALWINEPVPPHLSFAETVAAIHEQDGIAILAHPFHVYMSVVRNGCRRYWNNARSLIDVDFDAIEVHNASVPIPGTNLPARMLAAQIDIAQMGNSDAHSPGGIGSGRTRFDGHSAAELRHAIETRQTSAHGTFWRLQEYPGVIRNLLAHCVDEENPVRSGVQEASN